MCRRSRIRKQRHESRARASSRAANWMTPWGRSGGESPLRKRFTEKVSSNTKSSRKRSTREANRLTQRGRTTQAWSSIRPRSSCRRRHFPSPSRLPPCRRQRFHRLNALVAINRSHPRVLHSGRTPPSPNCLPPEKIFRATRQIRPRRKRRRRCHPIRAPCRSPHRQPIHPRFSRSHARPRRRASRCRQISSPRPTTLAPPLLNRMR